MINNLVSWRELITQSMKEHGETFDDVEHSIFAKHELEERTVYLQKTVLDEEFCSGFGGSEGCSFTLWTKNRVYFPVVYDGSEWASSVPRNPCNEATRHVGGE